MKSTISEIKNTPDGINSTLKEAVEGINYLKDKVMANNQAEEMSKKYANLEHSEETQLFHLV